MAGGTIASFTVNGANYQAAKLNVFDQMVIAKRLMPVIKGILTPEIMAAVAAMRKEGGGINLENIDIGTFLPAMADAIHSLSDDDAERICKTALKVVSRQSVGGAWGPVLTNQGLALFDDIDLVAMLQISWQVIEGNLGSFFSTAR